MHIVHVTRISWEHGTHGGMEAYSRTVEEALRQRGHRVTTITSACPGCERQPETIYLDGTRAGRYSRGWWRGSTQLLKQLQDEGSVDAILSESAAARAYVLAGRRDPARLPTVFVLHGTLASELRTHWRTARSARGAARLAKLLVTAGPDWFRWRLAAPGVARWIAVSEQVAADAHRTLGLRQETLTTVASGIDTTLWRPDPQQRAWLREEIGVAPENPVMVGAGRIEQGKGFHIAIGGLAALDRADVHLVILGVGSAMPGLKQLAAEAGVAERVHFPGFVEPKRLSRYFQGADILLMPSIAEEALGLVALQGLATGLPVVASNVGGIPTAVASGENGFLVRPGDSVALAKAVNSLLGNEHLRTKLSKAAREHAVAKFGQERMIDEIEATLKQLVDGGEPWRAPEVA